MQLTFLRLQHFRPYTDLTLQFGSGVNVVLAPNGVGKTSLIDAAGVVLEAIVRRHADRLVPADLWARFDSSGKVDFAPRLAIDARVGAYPLAIRAEREGVADRSSLRTRVVLPEAAALDAAVFEASAKGEPIPVFGRISATRATLTADPLSPPDLERRSPLSRDAGWSLDLDLAARWVDLRDDWAWVYLTAHPKHSPIMEALKQTVGQALRRALGVDEPPAYSGELHDFMVYLPGDGWRPVHQMSDGWRSFVAIIVAIALRAGMCHQGEPDAGREAIGTVLIDELEQHLHPQLQREILGGLRRAFPKVQLIVTTHSPLVLTDALGPDDQIMRLEADENGSPRVRMLDSVRGLDIEAIVTGPWFGLESTLDDESLQLMADYRAAVRKREAGREERARLEGQLKALLAKFHPHGLEGLGIELAAEIEGRFGHQLRTWDDVQRVKQEVLRLIDAAVKG